MRPYVGGYKAWRRLDIIVDKNQEWRTGAAGPGIARLRQPLPAAPRRSVRRELDNAAASRYIVAAPIGDHHHLKLSQWKILNAEGIEQAP